MSEKRIFKDDWSDLSDNQVLENIKYLQENYKKYTISIPDCTRVLIGNVLICRKRMGEYSKTFYVINNKEYCRETNIGKEIIDLAHFCRTDTISFKEKLVKWIEKNKYFLIGCGMFVLLSNIAYFSSGCVNKKQKDIAQKIINYKYSVNQKNR